jgi:hypothetical protein
MEAPEKAFVCASIDLKIEADKKAAAKAKKK